MWFIIGTCGLLPYSLFFFIFARAQLVGGGGCTEVGEVGRGGERNVSWGFGEGLCFKKGGPFFCNKERREERKRTQGDEYTEGRRVRVRVRVREEEGRALRVFGERKRKVVEDWIGEDFHPRPAVGCGRTFRAR